MANNIKSCGSTAIDDVTSQNNMILHDNNIQPVSQTNAPVGSKVHVIKSLIPSACVNNLHIS